MPKTALEKIQDKVLYINDNESKRAYYLTNPIELTNPTEKTVPYKPIFRKGDKALAYIGLHHTRDPESEAIKLINQTINEFQPELILFESQQNINDFRQEAIENISGDIQKYGWYTVALNAVKNQGENFYLLVLAIHKNIAFDTIEGSKKDEIAYLLKKGYTKNQIFFSYCIGVLLNFHRTKAESLRTKEYFIKLLQRTLDDLVKNTDWLKYDFSYNHFRKLYKKFVDFDFDITDERSYKNFASYCLIDQGDVWEIFNKLNADNIRSRDRNCVKRIYEALQTHNRVMAVMGITHPMLQQPAIREIFELLP